MTVPHDGGPSAPFGSQHADDGLPRLPSNNLPGAGDASAIADYIEGKRTGDGYPLGGADPNMNRMTRHGVRQARKQASRQSHSTKPLKAPGMDSSAKKTGY